MFTEICRKNILILADVYATETGLSPTKVSATIYGNGTFFRELRARRRSVSVEQFGKMLAKFATLWPDGTAWPDLQTIHFSRENLLQQRFVTTPKVPTQIRKRHAQA